MTKKEYNKEYYLKNKEKLKQISKEYRLKNREKIKQQRKKYYLKNKEKILKKTKGYYKKYYLKRKEHYLKNREYYLKYKKEYFLKNKEKILKKRKEYRLKNRKKVQQQRKKSYFKNTYNLTLEQFNEKLNNQNNKCVLCDTTFDEKINKAYVDHNHQTGKIRDILCFNCNSGLGKVKEDKNILNNMINYLNKHNSLEPCSIKYIQKI
jgi:hypothetical protein